MEAKFLISMLVGGLSASGFAGPQKSFCGIVHSRSADHIITFPEQNYADTIVVPQNFTVDSVLPNEGETKKFCFMGRRYLMDFGSGVKDYVLFAHTVINPDEGTIEPPIPTGQ